MAYATAAFPNVGGYGAQAVVVGNYRRAIGDAAVGFGTLTFAGATAGLVTATAAWMIAAAVAANPNLRASAPIALEAVALNRPYRRLPGVADLSPLAWLSTRPAFDSDLSLAGKPTATPSDSPPVRDLPSAQEQAAEITIPLPPSRPIHDADMQARHDAAPAAAGATMPRLAAAAPLASAKTFSLFQKSPLSEPAESHSFVMPGSGPGVRVLDPGEPKAVDGRDKRGDDDDGKPRLKTASLPPLVAPNNSTSLRTPNNHPAVYDIEAHIVYLPNGERLEAHSGLGYRLDDPRYVREKARGPTPPNVYELALREQPFHGVRAIRLNPVDDGKMFGRDGILAHTYMLGPSGQSFGCVSFRDYQKFLQAFLRGEIDRLVVVPHLENRPSVAARAGREQPGRFAFSDE